MVWDLPIGQTLLQVQITARMQYAIRRAAKKTGRTSSAAYIRHVMAEALERDLGVTKAEMLDGGPNDYRPGEFQPPRAKAGVDVP